MRWLVVVAALAGCPQPRSERCKFICNEEKKCIDQTKAETPFDEKECVAACSVLEEDPSNSAKVEKHHDCVVQNKLQCATMLKCP